MQIFLDKYVMQIFLDKGDHTSVCNTVLTFIKPHCVDNPWHPHQFGLRTAV